jgi:hypothetical protein
MVKLTIRSRAKMWYVDRSLTKRSWVKEALGNWLLVFGKNNPKARLCTLRPSADALSMGSSGVGWGRMGSKPGGGGGVRLRVQAEGRNVRETHAN